MSDADAAYELAQQEIARVKAAGRDTLRLSGEAFRALDRVPPELADLTDLRLLSLHRTEVSDLAPLKGLTSLQTLWINFTQVSDLAPLRGLTSLQTLSLDVTLVSDLLPMQNLTRLQGLWLESTQVSDLAPLQNLTSLQTLGFSGTQVSDLAPLRGLTSLQGFDLEGTQVSDLRPIAGLQQLASEGPLRGLRFRDTPATQRDARLAELAQIENNENRTRQTLDYLRSLPPWPAPYTPAAPPESSFLQPIGEALEKPKVKAAKAQIRHLLQNSMLTRLSAQQFAGQIKDALRDVPATNGNYLAEPLQTMLEFADALEGLAPSSEPATDPLDRAKLELQISYLEALVTRLTQQLQDETKAREVAEALAGKGEFRRNFKKGAALAAGTAAVGLVTVGVPTAAVWFLGPENPLIQSFLTVMGRLPKQ